MTLKYLAYATFAGVILTGCMSTAPMEETDPLQARLSGMTGVHESGTTVTLGEDGSVSGTTQNGEAIIGLWEVRDGRYCRTLTAPKSLAGSGCQDVEFDGNKAIFTKDDGTSSTFVIQG
ncbi:hypothetical protein [Roseovarius sp. SYSU LYC5161]|uniref:hypothetical protein n=1 Tax=Roseovarius halophilus (ex Wu et al. 2025) TaxID=3376060 RepID=UPI0028724A90|nr:hypothetical protein [Roseovarius sp.]